MNEPIDRDRAELPRPGGSAPAEESTAKRVAVFAGGFLAALALMVVCGLVGGSAAGVVGGLVGGVGGPVSLIVFARSHGIRPLAAGAITASAIVVIVFGGCLMVLSGGHW